MLLGLTAGAVGCSTLADGGSVSVREVANEGIENRQETKEAVDDIEKNLAEIKKFRKEGNFRAAEYREKYLDRNLKKLKG